MVAIESLVAGCIAISGSLAGVISALCWNIRRSRCTSIKCWGCSCDREVMTKEEMNEDGAPSSAV
jgi:hypothetical protein